MRTLCICLPVAFLLLAITPSPGVVSAKPVQPDVKAAVKQFAQRAFMADTDKIDIGGYAAVFLRDEDSTSPASPRPMVAGAGPLAGYMAGRFAFPSLMEFLAADTSDNLEMTLSEWEAWLNASLKGKEPEPSGADISYAIRRSGVRQFMKLLADDADKDGKLSTEELKLNETASEMFEAADLNGDESLDIHEYPGWYGLRNQIIASGSLPDHLRVAGSTWRYKFPGGTDMFGSKREDRYLEYEVIAASKSLCTVQCQWQDAKSKAIKDLTWHFRLNAAELAIRGPLPKDTVGEPETVNVTAGKFNARKWHYLREGTRDVNPIWETYVSEELGFLPIKGREDQGSFELVEWKPKKLPGAKPDPKAPPVDGNDDRSRLTGAAVFSMYDKSVDGKITAKEYIDANAAYRDEQCKNGGADLRAQIEPLISPRHFLFADKDDEAGLSRTEFDEYWARFSRRGSYPAPSTISRADVERLVALLGADDFDRHDTNRDGKITEADEIAGDRLSALRRKIKSDLNKDGEVTRGEIEEKLRADFLSRTPNLQNAAETDSGKHDWKLEDKNLNFALFQKKGRSWSFKFTTGDKKKPTLVATTENRILMVDTDGCVMLTRVRNDKGRVIVAAKFFIAFTPDNEALLALPDAADLKETRDVSAAGRKWKCDVYASKLQNGVETEEWVCKEFPGLRVHSEAFKDKRQVSIDLATFKD